MKKLQKTLFTTIFGIICYLLLWLSTASTSVVLPQTGEPPILYSNQVDDDLKLTFEQAIREANESVLLIIYSLIDPKIIQTLRNKAEEGVEVVVICDPEASAGVEKKLGSKVSTYKRCGQGIMHQKILVTDHRRVWIGSANMTTQSLLVHGNLVVGLHHEELASALHEKADSMIQTGAKRAITHRFFAINDQQIEMWFLPEDTDAIYRLKQLIKTAKKSIYVAMFTWTRHDLAKELIKARNKGIQVEVALDRGSASGVSSKVAKLLADDGIPVILNSGSGLLHHKMMVIDDETLVIGSANWTLAAFEKNNDCFMVIYPLNETQKRTLHRLWKVIAE